MPTPQRPRQRDPNGLRRTQSGLYVANGLNFADIRKTKRTVTLPTGERALVTVDDSGTVMQIERAEGLDAIVRPKVVTLRRGMRPPGGGPHGSR